MSFRLLITIALLACACAVRAQEPLRSVAAVRELSREEVARNPPVLLRGVVTYHEPGAKRTFVQDETGGIYALVETEDHPTLRDGTEVEVAGVAFPGTFATHLRGRSMLSGKPYFSSVELRPLGPGKWPQEPHLRDATLMQPRHHCNVVQLDGAIRGLRFEGTRALLEVSSGGRAFTAIIPGITDPEDIRIRFLFREARLRGVYLALFRETGQMQGFELYVPGPGFIGPAALPKGGFFEVPETSVAELLRFSPQRLERVRMRGVVTLALPGEGLFLETRSGSLWAATNQPIALAPGDFVDVAGIAGLGPQQQPALEDGVVRPVAETAPPVTAPPLSAAAARAPEHDGELVSIEARLGQVFAREGRRVFVLHADGVEFVATETTPGQWTAPPRNSWVRVTGICRVAPADEARSGERSFRVLLRGPGDLAVLRAPRWHESEQVLWALGAAVALGLAALVWSFTLRRRVAEQTGVIEKKIERERVNEERQRIARDLHDSLQQELAGLGLQLEAAQRSLPENGAAADTRSTLDLACTMLRRTQVETRRAVWDLGPEELSGAHLGETLAARLHPLNRPGGPQLDVQTEGAPRRLPGITETQLLRIAQEAVANTLQHGHATRISVRVTFADAAVTLRVEDDGHGFDPAAALAGPPEASFGLRSMRSRARRLGAEFSLDSQPGSGTRVEVRLREEPGRPRPESKEEPRGGSPAHLQPLGPPASSEGAPSP